MTIPSLSIKVEEPTTSPKPRIRPVSKQAEGEIGLELSELGKHLMKNFPYLYQKYQNQQKGVSARVDKQHTSKDSPVISAVETGTGTGFGSGNRDGNISLNAKKQNYPLPENTDYLEILQNIDTPPVPGSSKESTDQTTASDLCASDAEDLDFIPLQNKTISSTVSNSSNNSSSSSSSSSSIFPSQLQSVGDTELCVDSKSTLDKHASKGGNINIDINTIAKTITDTESNGSDGVGDSDCSSLECVGSGSCELR